jgi:hypothetical protein
MCSYLNSLSTSVLHPVELRQHGISRGIMRITPHIVWWLDPQRLPCIQLQHSHTVDHDPTRSVIHTSLRLLFPRIFACRSCFGTILKTPYRRRQRNDSSKCTCSAQRGFRVSQSTFSLGIAWVVCMQWLERSNLASINHEW